MFRMIRNKISLAAICLLSLVLLVGCAARLQEADEPRELLGPPGLPEEAEDVIPFAQIYCYEDGQASQFYYCTWNTENNLFNRGELLYTGAFHDGYLPEAWAPSSCRQRAGSLLYTRDGQEQTAGLPENAPGELCCAAVEDGVVTAVYKEDIGATALTIAVARYPLAQPEAAKWVRTVLQDGDGCYVSNIATSRPVYADGVVYLEAGDGLLTLEAESGAVGRLDLEALEALCPDATHSSEAGYTGVKVTGYYDGVLFVQRSFFRDEAFVANVTAAYRDGAPLGAILSGAEGGVDQLYLWDGTALKAAGDFPLSAEGDYQGCLFPRRFWQLVG